MASIPELLDGHVTLEVECLDRLYLNGYIGNLATVPQLSIFMRQQLKKPVPSPVVLGQITEKFREAVKRLAAQQEIPLHEFKRDEDKDEIGNDFRRKRGTRDGIVFIGVAQEKAYAFSGKKNDEGGLISKGTKQFTSITTTFISMTRTLVRCSLRSAVMRLGR